MLTIQISDSQREFENSRDIDESWINQQIDRRRRAGVAVCVRLVLNTNGVNMSLKSAGYPPSGNGGRPPNAGERAIFFLWENSGLEKPDFQGGNLVIFLKQLRKIIG